MDFFLTFDKVFALRSRDIKIMLFTSMLLCIILFGYTYRDILKKPSGEFRVSSSQSKPAFQTW